MPSLTDRDRILRESWRNAQFILPDPDPRGAHFAVEVWGVIRDRSGTFRSSDSEQTFQDVVSYWPASNKWTVTHVGRGQEDATDYPCDVLFWQPLPPLPWSY